MRAPGLLTAQDVVPDAALSADRVDRFDNTAIAGWVAELACVAATPTNVALFGPWGSGKSSLYATLRRSTRRGVASTARSRGDGDQKGEH